jgi:hypothetical protein
MKADLTRKTFDVFQHFDRVLLQQGRVQIDADWNEQTAILLHYLRTLATDLIGPQGGPANTLGFGITPFALAGSVITDDFIIGLGRYYVDGILCEADSQPVPFEVSANAANTIHVDRLTLDGTPFFVNQFVEVFDDAELPNSSPAFAPTVVQISNVDPANLILTLHGAPAFNTPAAPKLRRVYSYLSQPDYPVPATLVLGSETYLIYLDVWERLITYLEDDAIREVALGGPDTAARGKVVWQVKAIAGKLNPDQKNVCDGFAYSDEEFAGLLDFNGGYLKARARQTDASTDPCIIPPNASYTGPENQLYRIEIHRSGPAWDGTTNGASTAATFKWSRENGSVVFPIVSVASGSGTTTVVLETLGRDDRFGLSEGDWVDIQDDTYVLQNRAEAMLQVQSIDAPSLTVTLNGASTSGVGTDPTRHPLLRRWDYKPGDEDTGGLQLGSDMAALVEEETGTSWLSIEDGIQIQFQPPDTGQPATSYRTGDYWLIPARTATGDVEWPTEMEKDNQGNTIVIAIAKPPDGIHHHYAALGVISTNANGVTLNGDCRKRFSPLAN